MRGWTLPAVSNEAHRRDRASLPLPAPVLAGLDHFSDLTVLLPEGLNPCTQSWPLNYFKPSLWRFFSYTTFSPLAISVTTHDIDTTREG